MKSPMCNGSAHIASRVCRTDDTLGDTLRPKRQGRGLGPPLLKAAQNSIQTIRDYEWILGVSERHILSANPFLLLCMTTGRHQNKRTHAHTRKQHTKHIKTHNKTQQHNTTQHDTTQHGAARRGTARHDYVRTALQCTALQRGAHANPHVSRLVRTLTPMYRGSCAR